MEHETTIDFERFSVTAGYNWQDLLFGHEIRWENHSYKTITLFFAIFYLELDFGEVSLDE